MVNEPIINAHIFIFNVICVSAQVNEEFLLPRCELVGM